MTPTPTALMDHWQEACEPGVCGDVILRHASGTVLRVVMADACGHGRTAAAAAMQCARLVRPRLSRRITTAELCAWNEKLEAMLPQNSFVAATVVEFDRSTGRASIWNAGNPAPRVLRRSRGEVIKVEAYGLPLGALDASVYVPPTRMTISLNSDDELVLFTDGVTDQRRGDEPFGDARLQRCLEEAMALLVDPVEALRRAVHAYRAGSGWDDDLTLVRISGGAEPAVKAMQEAHAA